MRVRRLSILLVLALAGLPVGAQKIKTVSGTYIYVVPESQSFVEAEATALERAKLQLLSDTFGTTLDMSATTSISDAGSRTQALSQSSVRGEWLETIGEPRLSRIFESGELAIKVDISGKVREITASSADFLAQVLCNVPDQRFASDTFKSGDGLYLWFQAPADGYLAVYLYDGADDVYCLLPYRMQREGAYPVKGGHPYLFFSPDDADGLLPPDWVDEYVLSADRPQEINRMYVVYSANRFTKALDSGKSEMLPRELGFADFQRWLSRVRTEDRLLGIKEFNLIINQ